MNKKIKRLTLLKSLAANKEKHAADIFSKAKMFYQKEVKQLDTLYEFKEDYVSKVNSAVGQTMTTMTLNNQFKFVYYLDDICIQQGELIKKLEIDVQRYQELWIEAKRKTNALDDILQRLIKEHRLMIDKKEQKMNDEAVLQKYAHASIKKDNQNNG